MHCYCLSYNLVLTHTALTRWPADGQAHATLLLLTAAHATNREAQPGFVRQCDTWSVLTKKCFERVHYALQHVI